MTKPTNNQYLINATNYGSLQKYIINATTLPDAFFRVNEACYKYGREYTIEEGSYVGQKRRELDFLLVHITHPTARPLLPETKDGLPDPVTGGIDFIENDYLRTIMTPELDKNTVYTYGERLFKEFHKGIELKEGIRTDVVATFTNQVDEVIEKFKRGFNNNQCTLSISKPEDIILKDPACLRQIDCRIFENEKKLHFYIYFRSNDLFNGFPSNLAALVYLNEYMCEEIGQNIIPGEFIYMTKGAHIYDYAWDVVRDYIGETKEKI